MQLEESRNLAWHGARAETQGFEIKLRQSFDPSAGGADVFPQDIRRALLNLIANGFYAATKRRGETNGGDYEPTLAASTRNLGDRIEIRIRDNGTGIAPDVKEKMLDMPRNGMNSRLKATSILSSLANTLDVRSTSQYPLMALSGQKRTWSALLSAQTGELQLQRRSG